MRVQVMLVAVVLVLAGCNRQPSGQETMDPDVSDTASAASPAPTGPAHAGADFRLDQPIPKKDIRTTLALAVPPVYRAEDDTLLLRVLVGNQGGTPLVGQGDMPVQLGITLAGPEGVDKAPGRRNFARARLPLVQPGSSAEVKVAVPASEILGLKVNAELVQERAAWFGRQYKQPILEIGTFQRCDGAEKKTLCDATGAPVPPAAAAAPSGQSPEGRAEAPPVAPQQG